MLFSRASGYVLFPIVNAVHEESFVIGWSPFRNAMPGDQQSDPRDEPAPSRAARKPQVPATAPLALDAIGQRDEVLRQRIGVMIDRLDDLRTLQEDFSSILEPIAQISGELPRASMRIAELDASLAQERQSARIARQESADLARRVAMMASELTEAVARAEKLDGDLRDHDG